MNRFHAEATSAAPIAARRSVGPSFRKHAALFPCALAFISCGGEDGQKSGSLIDNNLWVLTEETEDPFSEFQEERPRCDTSALSYETDGFEVNTTGCGYVTVEQATGTAVEKGDALHLDLSWGPLLAPAPTEATIEIRLSGATLFQEVIPVPSDADIRTIDLTAPVSAERGSTIYFHIRNHGTNSYKLRSLSVDP